MIIIFFPKTLGGVSFEKAGKLYEGEETIFSIKRFPLPHTPTPSKRTTKGDSPFGIPKFIFIF